MQCRFFKNVIFFKETGRLKDNFLYFFKDNNLRVFEGIDLVPSSITKDNKEDVNAAHNTVRKLIGTSADKITNLSFSTKYGKLAISTNRVCGLVICYIMF